jgi:uncharacterized DUF497 family protein
MRLIFDPLKDQSNQAKHGLSFSDFQGFDAEPEPLTVVDDRVDYGEIRYQTFGRINGVGYMVVTAKSESALRLISFRRAHEKEMRRYGI